MKEKGLDKAAGDLMRKLCEKYDNLLEVDKLAAVMNKVDSVKLVLQENVQVALANCVTLENIEKAAGVCVCMCVFVCVCVCIQCERFPSCSRSTAIGPLTQYSLTHTHTHTPIEDLQAQAGMFKKNATTLKKQMWWKQLRVRPCVSVSVYICL